MDETAQTDEERVIALTPLQLGVIVAMIVAVVLLRRRCAARTGDLIAEMAVTGAGPEGGGEAYIRDWLRTTDPGTAFSGRFFADEGIVTVFMIHEDHAHVAALPSQVMITVKTGFFVEDGVGVLAIAMRIEDQVFETWLNRHLDGRLEESFEDLAQQEKLHFNFYVDDVKPARSIWIPNVERDTFARILEALNELEPWPMAAFDRARVRIEARFPSVQALWDGLGGD